MFDGSPELVSVKVPDASAQDGEALLVPAPEPGARA